MSDTPSAEVANPTIQIVPVTLDNDQTSGRRARQDWEKWIVRVSQWGAQAGEEDCDGVVWPTESAIQMALQVIQQLRSEDFAEPTEITPSGDGGIVLSRRTKECRQEIAVSDSGDAELLLFADGRLIGRKPW